MLPDRGEMKEHSVENLINNLNLTIEKYVCSVIKSIVERFFRAINERIENFSAWCSRKILKARNQIIWLEAKLTLTEITEIVIRSVLLHNIQEIEKYPLTPELIKDGSTIVGLVELGDILIKDASEHRSW